MPKQTENQTVVAALQAHSLGLAESAIERAILTLQRLRDLLPHARRDVWAAASVRIAAVGLDLGELVKHIESFGLALAHQPAEVPVA